ncbi:hypothetical protein HK100_001979 [Physocladia obscura]|uniref:Poly(A) RNA polymerase mitochondrial-like central palm domain-containing protein n=1 Tax=Physocladia obscura TaxID=109957 RepID=A0AAD5SY09_9FUNG|nr:hypothetical protein HK100_001979 [Physocladia obscura]
MLPCTVREVQAAQALKQKPKATKQIRKEKKTEAKSVKPAAASTGNHLHYQVAPWLDIQTSEYNETATADSNAMHDSLNKETRQLLTYLSASLPELRLRTHLTSMYSQLITQRFPASHTAAFGSSATGLFLPWSDVDLVVLEPSAILTASATNCPSKNNQAKKLQKVYKALLNANFARNASVISRARVPVLKLTDRRSSLNVDICYGQQTGVDALEHISKWIRSIEGLKELVLLVKMYLSSKDLSEVFSGGLGGYSIVSLCFAFLTLSSAITQRQELSETAPSSTSKKRTRQNPTPYSKNSDIHGTNFLSFCHYFGRVFSYTTDAISFTAPTPGSPLPTPHIVPRVRVHKTDNNQRLQLMNPLDPTADLTIGCNKTANLVDAFNSAVETVESIWDRLNDNAENNGRKSKKQKKITDDSDEEQQQSSNRSDEQQHLLKNSLLSRLIHISNEMIQTRKNVKRAANELFGLLDADFPDKINSGSTDDSNLRNPDLLIAHRNVETLPAEVTFAGIMMQDSDLMTDGAEDADETESCVFVDADDESIEVIGPSISIIKVQDDINTTAFFQIDRNCDSNMMTAVKSLSTNKMLVNDNLMFTSISAIKSLAESNISPPPTPTLDSDPKAAADNTPTPLPKKQKQKLDFNGRAKQVRMQTALKKHQKHQQKKEKTLEEGISNSTPIQHNNSSGEITIAATQTVKLSVAAWAPPGHYDTQKKYHSGKYNNNNNHKYSPSKKEVAKRQTVRLNHNDNATTKNVVVKKNIIKEVKKEANTAYGYVRHAVQDHSGWISEDFVGFLSSEKKRKVSKKYLVGNSDGLKILQ